MSSKKAFFEVFPGFDPGSGEIKDLFSEVMVSKVTMTSSRTKIDVYIECPHPIHKKDLYLTQKALSGSLDEKGRVKVILHEKFLLSDQYNASIFYDEYKGSIAYGMKAEQPLMYSVYHEAHKNFDSPESMTVTLQDTIVSHTVAEKLIEYLSEIFNDRAGLSCNIKLQYEKAEASPERLEAERRVQREIAEISQRAQNAKKPEVKQKGSYSPKKTDNGKARGQGNNKGGSYNRSGSGKLQKSDDPDVIYKYDVPEQSTPISELEGEMGEVVVRGEVMSYEDKEVKDGTLLMMRFNLTDYTDTIGVRIFPPIEEGKKLRERALGVPGKMACCVNLSGEEAETLYVLLYKTLHNIMQD